MKPWWWPKENSEYEVLLHVGIDQNYPLGTGVVWPFDDWAIWEQQWADSLGLGINAKEDGNNG